MSFDSVSILLIEDNPGDAELVRLALQGTRGTDFRIKHVDRLGTALTLLKRTAFDAVLLDLSLPDSHGLDTVNQVKATQPAIPIVVLSGFLDESLAIQAVKSGAQDYLVKGQGDSYLMARAIRYAMERKRAQEALRKSHEELESRVAERTAELAEANRSLQAEIGEHRRDEERLKREHAFNLALLDTVGSLIVVLDPEGKVVHFNRTSELVTGYTFDEVNQCYFWDVFLPDEDIPQVKAAFEQVVGGQSLDHYENHWQTKAGDRRCIVWSSAPLRDGNGRVEHIIASGNDITERKQLEERDKQRLMELAHLLRLNTLGEMTTEITHELNQPLTAITTYSDVCRRKLGAARMDPGELGDIVDKIARQAQRAGEIIRRLRSFARKATPNQVPLDINGLIRDVARLVHVDAQWNGVAIELALADTLPAALADKTLIEQVVVNLARNAIETMVEHQSNDPALTIKTRLNGNDMIEVAVCDNGPGVDAEVLEHLFEPFFTTKADGIGVGLSLSRSIIEAHGGHLRPASNSGAGATFLFTVPASV